MTDKISRSWWIGVAAGLLILAGGLRFYRLDLLPPGLHFDEAFHQVEAVGILQGQMPIYFTENMGMDPLHIYLIAVWFRLFGVTHLGGRLISALAGTLTIPTLWWLVEEWFADWETGRRKALAAVSSFTLAAMQWHITLSRTGIQPILVPLLLALSLACLWRGLRTGRAGWFIGGGVCLGLGPYAYSSARVTPLLIIFSALWLFLFQRDMFKRRWSGLLMMVGVSIAVFAPLGFYFITHWQQFTFRAGQVTFYTLGQGSTGPLRALGLNLLRSLAALNFQGDMEMIRNWPGRPALDVFQSLLFGAGLIACARHAKCLSYTALPVWIGVMLLPTILTEYAPHFGRALGAAPAVAVLVGLGADTVWRWAAMRLPRRWPATAALMSGLLLSAAGHGCAYFVRWGGQPGLYTAYDVGLFETARQVYRRAPDAQVYLSPIQMGHPILRFVTWDRPGAKSYDGRYALVLPTTLERPADFVIVPYLDDRSLARLARFYPTGSVVEGGSLRDGVSFYQVYRVPAHCHPQITLSHPLRVVWADSLVLIGYETDRPAYAPGQAVQLTLYWQSLAGLDAAYTAFTHLLGPENPQSQSRVWAGDDHEPGRASYSTSAWQPGEVVVDDFTLFIPADAPPGRYDIEVGWYQLQTMQRLPVSQADVPAGGDYALLGQVQVQPLP